MRMYRHYSGACKPNDLQAEIEVKNRINQARLVEFDLQPLSINSSEWRFVDITPDIIVFYIECGERPANIKLPEWHRD
jgi:hypothetical protein